MAATETPARMSSPPSPPSPTTGMKRRHSPSLSIDLSDLPPLTTPSNPSNTLIITNLADPRIFLPANLQSIRDALVEQAPLHSFSPLRSFRRIIAVFETSEDATRIRQLLDGESVLDNRIRVYFGEHTTLETRDQHLAAPQSQKLFFISPPPSPPMGWEMRNEDPPNKEVHAEDLVSALHKLDTIKSRNAKEDFPPSPISVVAGGSGEKSVQRSRSSTLVFDPADHGANPGLPAIAVEDTGADEEEGLVESPVDGAKIEFTHTARPPVELMEE